MWKRAASASIKTIIKHDFIMDVDIKELLKTVTENLDLSKFRGDVVGVKYVENEFGNIEPGGIGIQIINGKPALEDVEDEAFEPCELLFFDQSLFGSEEKQPLLVALLKDVTAKFDVTSGREWLAVYAGYRYFKGMLGVKGDYTDFFTDIEHLLPNVLTKLDMKKERTERYQKYTTLLGREADLWYMDEGKLPPIHNITALKVHFKGDWSRYEKMVPVIIEFYKGLRDI